MKNDMKSKRKGNEIFGCTKQTKIPMLDQFHPIYHPYIVNVVDIFVGTKSDIIFLKHLVNGVMNTQD